MWTCEVRLVCVFVERLRALGVLFPLRSVMFSFVTYIAIVLPAWKVLSRPFMEQRWNDGTEAVSLLTVSLCLIIFPLFSCPLTICPAGSGSVGRSSSRPASYAVVRRTSWYGSGSSPSISSLLRRMWSLHVASVSCLRPCKLQALCRLPCCFRQFPLSRHLLVGIFASAFKDCQFCARGFPPGILPSARFCSRAMMLLLYWSWCTCALARDGVRIRRIVQILREDCHAVS